MVGIRTAAAGIGTCVGPGAELELEMRIEEVEGWRWTVVGSFSSLSSLILSTFNVSIYWSPSIIFPHIPVPHERFQTITTRSVI